MAYIKCSNCDCFVEEGPSFCPECGNRLEYTSSRRAKKRSPIGWIITLVIIAALAVVGKWQYDVYQYGINLHNSVYYIMESAGHLEDAGIQFLSVWNNSVFEIQDDETDMYTRDETGVFYSDFNDALDLLISDKDYQQTIRQAEDTRSEASELMGKLTNPPHRYEEAYRNVKILYSDYMAFYNIVVNPSGNFSSYSDKFEQARDKLLEAYYSVSMY